MRSKVEMTFYLSKVIEVEHDESWDPIELINDYEYSKNHPDLKELNNLIGPIVKAGWEIEPCDEELVKDSFKR